MDIASIADIRTEYKKANLSETEAGADPILFFKKWFDEALHAQVREVNAMTLATVDAAMQVHARIVLLKSLEHNGFSFFTNYQSHKGLQLAQNPNAALVFFWPELERQVRVEGLVEKLSEAESDQYYNSRPLGSRIGAWVSPQSSIIESRAVLEEREAQFTKQFSTQEIYRPEYWGGFLLVPQLIEFWQGRASRLHDRICFERAHSNAEWIKNRLAP